MTFLAGDQQTSFTLMDLLTDHTFLEIFQKLKFLPELFAVAHKPADVPRSYPEKAFPSLAMRAPCLDSQSRLV